MTLRTTLNIGPARLRRGAFTLIEIMVTVALLSFIILGLMAMFHQTQRAFRNSITQTDVLEGARALNANFTGAVFRYARLSQCDFTGAHFGDADMSVADLRGTFINADFQGADLRGSKLENANLTGADLNKVKLDGANLIRANLTNAKFQPEQLHHARASGVIGRAISGATPQKRPWWQFWG